MVAMRLSQALTVLVCCAVGAAGLQQPDTGRLSSIRQMEGQLQQMSSWRQGWELMEFAGANITSQHVLQEPGSYTAFVTQPVCRRAEGEPFFQWLPDAAEPPSSSQVTLQSALNKGALALELVMGRNLFPHRLRAGAFQGKASPWDPPYAVYDVSSGDIFLEPEIMATVLSTQPLTSVVEGFTDRLFRYLPDLAGSSDAADQAGPMALVSQLAAWAPFAVAAAFAATPLWVCLACPIVLGMLVPFAFNTVLGEVAQHLCDLYQLPTDECNELWLGAFAVALVLSLSATVPIVYVCRLPQCGRQSGSRI